MNKAIVNIIPAPKKISFCDGEFSFSAVSSGCDGLSNDIDNLIYFARKLHGVTLTVGGTGLIFRKNEALALGEYKITVTRAGGEIEAAGRDGFTYAIATVMQLAKPLGDRLALPSVEIIDKPDCEYRALMVDLARKWHPFETLKRYIDLSLLYKIKYLHLHFTDTQSYTLPSDAFPKMPTVDRHYTKEEIVELNEYARSRNIEIIPEMDVPGHAKPMVIAYPELFSDVPIGDFKEDDYALFFGNISQNIICVGKPGVMDTLRVLTEEIISMFPYSRYFHIGGDEAAIGNWKNCRVCNEYMKKHGIDGPRPLYTHFIKKMTDMVLELGKTPIVWEGFPREGSEDISREVIVTAWESYYHLAPELIEEGFKITNSSWEPLYCVPKGHRVVTEGRWTPEEVLDWNVYTWKNWNQKTAAYEKPIVIEPTDQVLGATFCAWEDDYEHEIIPVKENLAAMSEKVWNVSSAVSKEDFMISLKKLLCLSEKLI